MIDIKKTLLRAAGLAALLSFSCATFSQTNQGLEQTPSDGSQDKKDWDVLNPSFELATVSIDTDQTTWSSLDVTPDGKHFVFDMLGIYTSPVSKVVKP